MKSRDQKRIDFGVECCGMSDFMVGLFLNDVIL